MEDEEKSDLQSIDALEKQLAAVVGKKSPRVAVRDGRFLILSRDDAKARVDFANEIASLPTLLIYSAIFAIILIFRLYYSRTVMILSFLALMGFVTLISLVLERWLPLRIASF